MKLALVGWNPRKIKTSKSVKKGRNLRIVAAKYLRKYDINCDIVDLRSIKPIDWDCIIQSVKKTGKLIVVDSGFSFGSIASEIISTVTERNFNDLTCAPVKMAMPDVPEPTSVALTKGFYIRASDIIKKVIKILDLDENNFAKSFEEPIFHDIPGDWFKGPF